MRNYKIAMATFSVKISQYDKQIETHDCNMLPTILKERLGKL